LWGLGGWMGRNLYVPCICNQGYVGGNNNKNVNLFNVT